MSEEPRAPDIVQRNDWETLRKALAYLPRHDQIDEDVATGALAALSRLRSKYEQMSEELHDGEAWKAVKDLTAGELL